MLQRIYLLALCIFLVGCTRNEKKNLQDLASEQDIFIDDAQADQAEGSAVAGDFSDMDEGASGMGPDDEDAFPASGEGSGAGSDTDDKPIIPPFKPEPTKKPEKPQKPRSTSAPSPVPSPTSPPQTTTPPRIHENKINENVGSVPNEENDSNNNQVHIMGQKSDDRPTSFFAQPGILAAVIGGAVVGLLCAILLVMFIVYRMRKKDEGSYALEEPKRSPTSNSYTRANKEFYA